MGPGQVKSDPEHQVTISKPFYMTVYPVTAEQYVLLMGLDGTPPLREPRRKDIGLLGRRPYKDAVEFCTRLSKVAGRTCRLPTEAEWEFSCRAGTSTRFFFGDAEKDLPRYTWLHKDIMSRDVNDPLPPVGQKLPNPWGLYDLFLCGEWCSDWGADYPKPVPDSQGNLPAGGLIDPKGPNTGTERVIRGEQWSLEDQRAPGVVGFGSRFRGRGEPFVPFAFRVVMEIK